MSKVDNKYNKNIYLNLINSNLFKKALINSDFELMGSIFLSSLHFKLNLKDLSKFSDFSHLHAMPYHIFIWLGSLVGLSKRNSLNLPDNGSNNFFNYLYENSEPTNINNSPNVYFKSIDTDDNIIQYQIDEIDLSNPKYENILNNLLNNSLKTDNKSETNFININRLFLYGLAINDFKNKQSEFKSNLIKILDISNDGAEFIIKEILSVREKINGEYTNKISTEGTLILTPDLIDVKQLPLIYRNIDSNRVNRTVKSFIDITNRFNNIAIKQLITPLVIQYTKNLQENKYENTLESFNKHLYDNLLKLAIKDSNPNGFANINEVLDNFSESFLNLAYDEFKKFVNGTSLHNTFNLKGILKALTTLSIDDFDLNNENDFIIFINLFGINTLTQDSDYVKNIITNGMYLKFNIKYNEIIDNFKSYRIVINNPTYNANNNTVKTKQNKINDFDFINNDKFSLYLNTINKIIKKQRRDSIKVKTSREKDTQYDLKYKTYYNVKNIYDNWVSITVGSENNLFYNLKSVNCRDDLNTPEINDTTLFDYVKILDRGNKPIGNDYMVNLKWLSDYFSDNLKSVTNEVNNVSLYGFLSSFAEKHNFLLHSLPAYIDLGNLNSGDIDAMFSTYNTVEKINTSPTFLLQHIGNMTSKLNLPNDNIKIEDKQFSFCLDENSELPTDISSSESSKAAFVVEFGNQEQQIFNNIELDQSEFQNTEESYQIIENIADKGSQIGSADLYEVYTSRSYSATISSLGNIAIQPLSYFYLKGLPMFYGTYWVTNVVHTISKNNMQTQFQGVRQPINVLKLNDEISYNYIQTISGDYTEKENENIDRSNITPDINSLESVLFEKDDGNQYRLKDALYSDTYGGTQEIEASVWGGVNFTVNEIIKNIFNLVEILKILKQRFGKYPKITSYYRGPALNSMLKNSATNSYHLIGAAVDIDYDGVYDNNGNQIDNIEAFTHLRDLVNDGKLQLDELIWELVSQPSDPTRKISNLHIARNFYASEHKNKIKVHGNVGLPPLEDVEKSPYEELKNKYGGEKFYEKN